jgi:hypothetical protein
VSTAQASTLIALLALNYVALAVGAVVIVHRGCDQIRRDLDQPHEPEWDSWTEGKGRCPICRDLPKRDFAAVCDCWQYEREFPNDTEFWA